MTARAFDRESPEHQAWLQAQLAKAPPLTAEQQRDLRRVLLPPKPVRKPA